MQCNAEKKFYKIGSWLKTFHYCHDIIFQHYMLKVCWKQFYNLIKQSQKESCFGILSCTFFLLLLDTVKELILIFFFFVVLAGHYPELINGFDQHFQAPFPPAAPLINLSNMANFSSEKNSGTLGFEPGADGTGSNCDNHLPVTMPP